MSQVQLNLVMSQDLGSSFLPMPVSPDSRHEKPSEKHVHSLDLYPVFLLEKVY